ncbi:cupin domain-containing protein [Arthrobacter sp.]|uniref:helix-turn-helix domain-containing protein n=1 Tax=Arthrobacter sp. TaxID=1667 RepID=UPI003391D249
MVQRTSADAVEIGVRIRSARHLRGISLRQLALDAGVSPGFMSHVENGRSGISISTLRNVAKVLGMTIAELVDGEHRHGRGVLRKNERPRVEAQGGLTKSLLTTTPLRNLEVYAGVFEPGGSTGDQLYSHGHAQEMVICIEGTVEVTVADEVQVLASGDLIDLHTSVPHGVRNIGDGTAEVLWIISPPTPD